MTMPMLMSVLLMAVPVDDRIWVPVEVKEIKVGNKYTIGVPYFPVSFKDSVPIPYNDVQMQALRDVFNSDMSDKQLVAWLDKQYKAGGKLYLIKPGTMVKVIQVKPATESVDVVFLDGKDKGRKAVVAFVALCTRE